jgi:hypothetical protein
MAKRKRRVVLNNANIYVIDASYVGSCYDIMMECSNDNKLECAISVSARESKRAVAEINCIGSDDTHKLLGAISKNSFDVEAALIPENKVSGKLYDAFDDLSSVIFVIEHLMNTGNYYEISLVKVSKRVRTIAIDEIVKYNFTLDPYGVVEDCKAVEPGSRIQYRFDSNYGWCMDEQGNNFAVDSGNVPI